MASKITMSQLRKKLESSLANEDRKLVAFASDSNPQVVEMRLKAEARREVFEAVIIAINGDSWLLNTFASEAAW
jgi:hypothetical protein